MTAWLSPPKRSRLEIVLGILLVDSMAAARLAGVGLCVIVVMLPANEMTAVVYLRSKETVNDGK